MIQPAPAVERAAAILGGRARMGVPLAPLTTYRVGGPAALFLDVDEEADLEAARQAVLASGVQVLVVGRGSNLLVADAGFGGLVLALGDLFSGVEVSGTVVRAGGGASLPVVARRSAAAGLTGLEWAVGVPGSIGGAVRMNAGGHGSDMAGSLDAVVLYDLAAEGEPRTDVDVPALGLGYRRSSVTPHQVVIEARFDMARGDRDVAEQRITEIVRWRREHQPGGANAGSVFANPPGDTAGRLVEAVGLKGHRRGSVCVSPKHSNFFQVDDGGSAADVRGLMEEVARIVREKTGVSLVPEVQMVGFDQP